MLGICGKDPFEPLDWLRNRPGREAALDAPPPVPDPRVRSISPSSFISVRRSPHAVGENKRGDRSRRRRCRCKTGAPWPPPSPLQITAWRWLPVPTPETITPSAPHAWSTSATALRHRQRARRPVLDEHIGENQNLISAVQQAPAAQHSVGLPLDHAWSSRTGSAEHIHCRRERAPTHLAIARRRRGDLFAQQSLMPGQGVPPPTLGGRFRVIGGPRFRRHRSRQKRHIFRSSLANSGQSAPPSAVGRGHRRGPPPPPRNHTHSSGDPGNGPADAHPNQRATQ